MRTTTPATLGQRLRTVRRTYGLSQRKLARLAGLSNATISLIEKDRLNPSIGTMFKILSVFPISIAEFWEAESPKLDRIFYGFEELTKIRHNKVTYWTVGEASPGSTMTFQYERYEPGMDGKEVSTAIETEIVGFILEGRLEVTVGDHRRILKAGDAYRFDGRIPHRFKTVGKTPATSISCTVPPVF